MHLHNAASNTEEVIVVANNSEALDILKKYTVTLLITDLEVSEFDGFNLLVYLAKQHPETQVTVLSDLVLSKFNELSSIHCVKKPKSLHDLGELIKVNLKDNAEKIAGNMLVGDFLLMIEVARKTCLLEVSCEHNKGAVYFYQGALFDSFCEHSQGEQTVLLMLDRKCSDISFRELPNKPFRRKIKTSLMSILNNKESFNRDKISLETHAEKSRTIGLLKDKVKQMKAVDNSPEKGDDKPSVATDISAENIPTEIKIKQTTIGKKIMASLEDSLKPLKEVDGYLASAIFDMSGEVLAQHNNSKYNVALIGANAVAMINSAVKAVGGAGLGKCNFIQVNSELGVFGAVWAVEDQSVAAVLLEPKANVGMAKLMLAKVGELSGSQLA